MSFEGLPEHPVDLILMDPPWAYYGSPDKMAAAGKHYNLVDTATLKQLPIPDLLNNPGLVFMWTTSAFLRDSMRLFQAWKLEYRGVAFVWVKTRKSDGGIIMGQGVRPSITKPTTELVLVASRQAKGRPYPLSDESIGQVILAPRGAHSEKPYAVHSRLNRMYPTLDKLELFARRPRKGWQVWGNEV